jgi:hypothetical protein
MALCGLLDSIMGSTIADAASLSSSRQRGDALALALADDACAAVRARG